MAVGRVVGTGATTVVVALCAAFVPSAPAQTRSDTRGAVPGAEREDRGRDSPHGIVDVPVTFTVRNVNRSRVPCASDGFTYSVRGHLTVSRGAIARGALGGSGGVTLYLHGSLVGESVWRSSVPGYSWVRHMAAAGHASVTIDQLGFGKSGLPDGIEVCVGSWADAAHQVVSKLRSGDYRLATGRRAPHFARVVLASYCLGGLIAQVEAYSFRDIDGFVMFSSAFDQGFSPAAAADLFVNPSGPAATCSRGGEPKRPGGPQHYAYAFKGTEAERWFYNAERPVIAEVVRRHEREPCGEGPSLPQAVAADRLYLREITVPVLLVFGSEDAIFPPPAGERQKALFSGSRDVTYVQVANAGHALQLARTAPVTRAAVSRWISARHLDGQRRVDR
ncbi:MAG: alpha/beta hydrolase [Actinobacteria bacterium]|nr:alpha/beta hydrolase [Actinomycetota bacterium]